MPNGSEESESPVEIGAVTKVVKPAGLREIFRQARNLNSGAAVENPDRAATFLARLPRGKRRGS